MWGYMPSLLPPPLKTYTARTFTGTGSKNHKYKYN